MIKAEIVVSPAQARHIKDAIERARTAGYASAQMTVKDLAQVVHGEVIRGYLSGNVPALGPGTLEARRQGKRAGKTPARSPVSGTKPFFETGRLLGSVEVYPVPRKGWGVRIRAGSVGTRGLNMKKLAANLEFGFLVIMSTSLQMRAYLKALSLGVAGTPMSVRAPNRPMLVTIRVPPRPVWVPAFQQLIRAQPFGATGMATMFERHFAKLYGQPIKMRQV